MWEEQGTEQNPGISDLRGITSPRTKGTDDISMEGYILKQVSGFYHMVECRVLNSGNRVIHTLLPPLGTLQKHSTNDSTNK